METVTPQKQLLLLLKLMLLLMRTSTMHPIHRLYGCCRLEGRYVNG